MSCPSTDCASTSSSSTSTLQLQPTTTTTTTAKTSAAAPLTDTASTNRSGAGQHQPQSQHEAQQHSANATGKQQHTDPKLQHCAFTDNHFSSTCKQNKRNFNSIQQHTTNTNTNANTRVRASDSGKGTALDSVKSIPNSAAVECESCIVKSEITALDKTKSASNDELKVKENKQQSASSDNSKSILQPSATNYNVSTSCSSSCSGKCKVTITANLTTPANQVQVQATAAKQTQQCKADQGNNKANNSKQQHDTDCDKLDSPLNAQQSETARHKQGDDSTCPKQWAANQQDLNSNLPSLSAFPSVSAVNCSATSVGDCALVAAPTIADDAFATLASAPSSAISVINTILVQQPQVAATLPPPLLVPFISIAAGLSVQTKLTHSKTDTPTAIPLPEAASCLVRQRQARSEKESPIATDSTSTSASESTSASGSVSASSSTTAATPVTDLKSAPVSAPSRPVPTPAQSCELDRDAVALLIGRLSEL